MAACPGPTQVLPWLPWHAALAYIASGLFQALADDPACLSCPTSGGSHIPMSCWLLEVHLDS